MGLSIGRFRGGSSEGGGLREELKFNLGIYVYRFFVFLGGDGRRYGRVVRFGRVFIGEGRF